MVQMLADVIYVRRTMSWLHECARCVRQKPLHNSPEDTLCPVFEQADPEMEVEGEAEQRTLHRLLHIHRNLGHPPNGLLTRVLEEARAPAD
eukprot:15458615-Alexandrium_andersonii.AAC.1